MPARDCWHSTQISSSLHERSETETEGGPNVEKGETSRGREREMEREKGGQSAVGEGERKMQGRGGRNKQEGAASGNITKHPAKRVSSSLCLLLYFTSFLIPPNSTVGDRPPPRKTTGRPSTFENHFYPSTFLPSIPA